MIRKFSGIMFVCLILFSTITYAKSSGEVLQEYGFVPAEEIVSSKDQLINIIEKLEPFSKESDSIFLDLINTLKQYSQEQDFGWQRDDLHKIAWAIKELDQKVNEQNDFRFDHRFETGYELEVIHNHGDEKPGTYLYQNPFKHDLDEDGQIDLFEQDEYMRQYLDVHSVVSGPQMDGAINVKMGLNYFGVGYLQNGNNYERQYDLTLPRIDDFTFSLYGPNFSATVGKEQILGFCDYLYYDDPENSKDYNLTGLTFQAPYGVFFGLGQETWNSPGLYEQPHDVRWIAVGTEGLGYLPVNLYIGEREIQNPSFKKVGRNVIFALTTDLEYEKYYINSDLAVNDAGDGYYTQLTLGGQIGRISLHSKAELAEHFTPIQAKTEFVNTVYVRKLLDGKSLEFPARTQKGFELLADYQINSDIKVNSSLENYLDTGVVKIGLDYQPVSDLIVTTSGEYDYYSGGDLAAVIESNYRHPYANISVKKIFGGTEDIQVTAEPVYTNDAVTLKGLLGYGVRPIENLKNSQIGIEVTYHPTEDFTFHAKYTMEDMMYGVDLPGLNFTRFGEIEYQFNDWVSASVAFKNIDFRDPDNGYVVEHSLAGIKAKF